MRLGNLALTVLFCATFGTSGCSRSSQPPAPANTQPSYVLHTVAHQGETLATIAKWYTGSSSNWQLIRDANPTLDPRKIRIGSTIEIPRELAVRTDAPPRPRITAVAKKGSTTTNTQEASPSAAEPDSFATTNVPNEIQRENTELAADLPQPPTNIDSSNSAQSTTAEVPAISPEPSLALENSGTDTSDRASPGLPLDGQPDTNVISDNSATESSWSDGNTPPGQPAQPGLVKGILEAVGNAALDSKKEASSPSN